MRQPDHRQHLKVPASRRSDPSGDFKQTDARIARNDALGAEKQTYPPASMTPISQRPANGYTGSVLAGPNHKAASTSCNSHVEGRCRDVASVCAASGSGLRRDWRLAYASRSFRRSAWPRQPHQGQCGGVADRDAQAKEQYQLARGIGRKYRRSHRLRRQGADRWRHRRIAPAAYEGSRRSRRRSRHASDQHPLAFRSQFRQRLAGCRWREDHRPREHPQASLRSSARRGLGL